jgi:hypothetical protein
VTDAPVIRQAIEDHMRARGNSEYAPMLLTTAGRKSLTVADPKLFALVYCPEVVTDAATGSISFGQHHHEWFRLLEQWADPQKPGPRESRHALIAPRGAGKTSFWLKLAMIWAGAFDHVAFASCFSATAAQAEQHLSSLRRTLDSSPNLRKTSRTSVGRRYGELASRSPTISRPT